MAILAIAIGIGANSAIFALLDAVLLKPLPFLRSAELVMIWEKAPGYDRNTVAPLNFLDWNDRNDVFAAMAAIAGSSRSLTGVAMPEQIPAQAVTAEFFDCSVLGRSSAAPFTAEDDKQGGPDVVVVSHGFWLRRLGGRRNAVGTVLELDGKPVAVA